MPLSTQRKVTLGFAAAVVVLAGIALATVTSMRALVASTERVNHTHLVLEALTLLEQRVLEAETDQRGYLLTGSPDMLQAYRQSAMLARFELDSLERLVSDSATRNELPALRELVARKMGFMEYVLGQRDGGNHERAVALVRTGEGFRLTQAIQRQTAAMTQRQRQLLAQHARQADRRLLETSAVLAAGFLVTLLVAAGAVLTLRRDLRERDHLHRQLTSAVARAENANRAKSDFLARMSHELRTPLNAIIGFANVLRKNRRGVLGDQELDFLDRVQVNGQHLLGIINDILDLAKVEAGRIELHPEPVSLELLVRDTVRQVEQRGAAKAVIAVDVPSELEPLETDPDKLRQVLVNLLGNALKFSEGRPVLVRVVAEPHARRAWRLDVEDHGIGIPPDRLGAIFESFEQAESTTARRFGGTGLGLAISRQLCERLGFELAVASEQGVGSTFSILLQRDAPRPERHAPALGGAHEATISASGEQVRDA